VDSADEVRPSLATQSEETASDFMAVGKEVEGRPESTPRLYNRLEVTIDPKTKTHRSTRVHTREQKKSDTAWQGYHAWPNPKGRGRLSYFDITLF
jgi:hypothetical protein